jgi:hypothetical protein
MSTSDEIAVVLERAFSKAAHAPVAVRGRTRSGKTTLLRRV